MLLGKDSFVVCMNLLVWCNRIRCVLGGVGIIFGFLMRVKMLFLVVREFGDELDGIIELECIVDEFC